MSARIFRVKNSCFLPAFGKRRSKGTEQPLSRGRPLFLCPPRTPQAPAATDAAGRSGSFLKYLPASLNLSQTQEAGAQPGPGRSLPGPPGARKGGEEGLPPGTGLGRRGHLQLGWSPGLGVLGGGRLQGGGWGCCFRPAGPEVPGANRAGFVPSLPQRPLLETPPSPLLLLAHEGRRTDCHLSPEI